MARFGTLSLTAFIALMIVSLSLSSASGQQPTGGALSKELADAVLGYWQGTARSPAQGEDKWDICFKPDGTVSGELQSVRGGWITFAGTYLPTDAMDGIATQIRNLTGPPSYSIKGLPSRSSRRAAALWRGR